MHFVNGREARAAGGCQPVHVFIAAPYSQWMDWSSGHVAAAPRAFLTALRHAMLERGWAVFSAHVNEGWGAGWLPPEVCTPADYSAVRRADVVCAVLGDPPSPGVLIELGWASALGKPTVILVTATSTPPHLVLGLSTLVWYRQIKLPGRLEDHHPPSAQLIADVMAACTDGASAEPASGVADPGDASGLGYRREG